MDQWGTIDVLVNNAGITRDTLIARMKPDQWQAVIDTNLTAPFYVIQASASVQHEVRRHTKWLTQGGCAGCDQGDDQEAQGSHH